MSEYRWELYDEDYGHYDLMSPDGREIATLGDSEDRTPSRDLKGITEELNELAKQLQTLTQERDAAHNAAIQGLSEKPTHEQLIDACMSYRHDFGLLDKTNTEITQGEAIDWWIAIVRALKR